MEAFVVVIERANDNYSAYLPDMHGCISTGNTVEETLENIKDALEFHLEGLAEEGYSLPETVSLETHLRNGDIVLDDDVIIANIHVELPKELIA